jgi:hypothetical protein
MVAGRRWRGRISARWHRFSNASLYSSLRTCILIATPLSGIVGMEEEEVVVVVVEEEALSSCNTPSRRAPR